MKRRFVLSALSALVIASGLVLSALAQSSEKVVKAKGFASTSAIRPGDRFKIAVQLDVAPGYHINGHVPSLDYLVATNVNLQPPPGIRIDQPVYPAPELKSFTFAPDTKLAVHEGTVIVTSDAVADGSLKPGETLISAKVEVQSCNDSQCLAPATLDVQIPVMVLAAGAPVTPANSDIFAKAAAQPTGAAITAPIVGKTSSAVGKVNEVTAKVQRFGLPVALIIIFFGGIALNGTPCVYPIIPITIGFFANQSKEGENTKLSRTFAMSAFYVLGIAITYSVLGVVASLTHGLFGAAMTNPFVQVGLALLMVALALSMFGVYEFRMPEFLNRFATSSTQATSGFVGALVMGLTMGIVAAPCIGPFVTALVVHVGEVGKPLYGLLLFFVLSLGLGAPYLVLGTFSGAISKLPRSGMWMVAVRRLFGVVLLGMAIYFLMPLLGKYSTPVLVVFFAAAAFYLVFWEARKAKTKQFGWVVRVIGLVAAGLAVFFILPSKTEADIEWQPYSEQALQTAMSEGKPVVIDAYADWCIPCKELDHSTFTDPQVKQEARDFLMLKLDLTMKDPPPEAKRAVQKFNIHGMPTITFLDRSGDIVDVLQGFEKPAGFLGRMKVAAGSVASANASSAASKGSESKDTLDDAKQLPSVNPTLVGGATYDFSAQRGKVLLIDFWATWCVPCASEIPMFNSMQQQYKDKGLEIVGVSTDEGGAAQIKPFLVQHPMQYTVAIAGDELKKAFGVGDTLPVTLVVDKQGRIRYSHTGITSPDTLRTEVEGLLKD